MVMISLRDYYREIESLIEASQNDEAIFHCMVILQTFPKSIETYRNLGKALLESKRYSEAAEVFSKILTVIPDDFITHVGLSVIKEEERDLDAAIWHMEQAFELQPSNLALQEELRRLFGRRDGVPPTKIRLTRGALVKMYARGELHQQAIAELKSVLKDEPSRVDYQALLAKMYMVSSAHTDAVELASSIISNFPYCFEANRILDELLENTDSFNGVNIYRKRLVELDPYYQYVDALTPNVADVPAEKVMLEKKIFSASVDTESRVSDWAKQIDINWKPKDVFIETETVDLLDQVEAFNGEAKEPVVEQPVSPFIGEVIPELNNQILNGLEEPEALPDWIANAGWTRSTESSNAEIEKNISLPFEEEDNQPNEPAVPSQELPEWLRALGSTPDREENNCIENDISSGTIEEPSKKLPTEQKSTEAESEELPEWLSAILPEDKSEEPDQENNSEKESFSEELPDWLKSLKPAEETEHLEDFKDEISEKFSSNQDDLSHSEELPDWLRALSDEDQLTSLNGINQDRSKNLSESNTEDDQKPLSSEEMKESLENWIEETRAETESEEREEKVKESEVRPSDWLNQFIESNGSGKNGSSNENLPDWLKEFESEDKGKTEGKSEQPDWLSSLKDNEIEPEDITIEKVPDFSETPLEPDIAHNIDEILNDLNNQPKNVEEEKNAFPPEVLSHAAPEIQGQAEQMTTMEEALESKPSIPSWVKNILSASTSKDSEAAPTYTQSVEDEFSTPIPDLAIDTTSGMKEKEEEIIEPLITDLPNATEHTGAISGNSKDELLSWLREVAPSDEVLPDEIIEPESIEKEIAEKQPSEIPFVEDLVRGGLSSEIEHEDIVEASSDETIETDFSDRLSELLQQPIDENISLEEIEESTSLPTGEANIEKNVEQIISELAIEAEKSEIPLDHNLHSTEQPAIEQDPLRRIESEVESGNFISLSINIEESISKGIPAEKIIETLEELSKKQPNSYELWRELGDLYLAESDFDKAMKAYNTAESILQQ